MVSDAPGATYAADRRSAGRSWRGSGRGDGAGSLRSVAAGEPQAASSSGSSTVWTFGARATMTFMDARTRAFPWVGVMRPPHPRGTNTSVSEGGTVQMGGIRAYIMRLPMHVAQG